MVLPSPVRVFKIKILVLTELSPIMIIDVSADDFFPKSYELLPHTFCVRYSRNYILANSRQLRFHKEEYQNLKSAS